MCVRPELLCHSLIRQRSSSYLERYEETNYLERVVTPVHVIPHEQVVRRRTVSADTEEFAVAQPPSRTSRREKDDNTRK